MSEQMDTLIDSFTRDKKKDMEKLAEIYDDDIYQNMCHGDDSSKELVKVYGVAFAFVVFGLMPWAVGACMLLKWILF